MLAAKIDSPTHPLLIDLIENGIDFDWLDHGLGHIDGY